MKTTVEALEDFQKKLTIELDAAEVDDRINKQYKDFAYRYNFPGFRKGKAPRPVVDNVLGAQAVVGTVTDDILNKLFPLAMDENNLVAIGAPQYEDVDTLVESGKPFSFVVTVPTRPEFELESYKPVEIKLPSTAATEEEIDAQVDELLQYYYDFEDAPASTKVDKGGFVEISMSAVNEEGEPVSSLTTDSRLYELGMGLFPPAFDEALVGMKKGDKKTVELDLDQPSLISQNVAGLGTFTVNVEIIQVKKRVVPEITDEWVKEKAGFENIEDLRTRISEQIVSQKASLLPRLRENEALLQLQKRLQGEAPESMLEAQEQELMQNFFYQLQQSGMSFDSFLVQNGLNPDTFKDDLKKQAADVVAQDLALDAWARHEKLEVSEEEISEEFKKSGAEDPAALEAQWRAEGRIAALKQSMLRSAALAKILDSLKVTELAPGEALSHDEEETKPASKKSTAKKSGTKKAAASKESKSSGKKEQSKETKKTASAKKASAEKIEGAEKKPAKGPAAKKTASKKDEDK